MANRHRGEIDAVLNGTTYTLCLTLGALAELEQTFACESMVSIVERFENGRMKSTDAIQLITAGLHGGGYDISVSEVANMRVEGGAKGYVKIIAELMNATFAFDKATDTSPSEQT